MCIPWLPGDWPPYLRRNGVETTCCISAYKINIIKRCWVHTLDFSQVCLSTGNKKKRDFTQNKYFEEQFNNSHRIL